VELDGKEASGSCSKDRVARLICESGIRAKPD